MVISYRRFRTSYQFHAHGSRIIGLPEDGTDRMYRSVGKKLPQLAASFCSSEQNIVHYLHLGLMIITEDECFTFYIVREKYSYINLATGMDRPWGLQEVKAPRFHDNRQVVTLSALCTGRFHPPLPPPFLLIMLMKNSNHTIGYGTRKLPSCSAVPQPTALSRALAKEKLESKVRT